MVLDEMWLFSTSENTAVKLQKILFVVQTFLVSM